MAEKLVATYINNFREKFTDVNFIQFLANVTIEFYTDSKQSKMRF
jgi:hypothetical protein